MWNSLASVRKIENQRKSFSAIKNQNLKRNAVPVDAVMHKTILIFEK